MESDNKHYNLIHNYNWKDSIMPHQKYFMVKIHKIYFRRVRLNISINEIIKDYSRKNINGRFVEYEGECINY